MKMYKTEFLAAIESDDKEKVIQIFEQLNKDYDELEYECDKLQDDVDELVVDLETLEASKTPTYIKDDTLRGVITEMLHERLFKYSPRKYDTVDKILDTLEHTMKWY